ncbi:ATP-binding protein [Palleronia caenipelagi]|uniref:histidine kinase n=1 Tax=Palleronia caenipelagi TaxID=2489174 RepID=A0A547QAS5_9RHOB|nr:ATP-binding protein [Palleronia caenipelagi]TRD23474.1 sodium:solute symporter [Palleronia caenipelagi]
MTTFNLLVAGCLFYVATLFAVAFMAERLVAQGKARWLRAPIVYTLSLSIYCTAWTFYGAVGFAARSGLEFVTIYLGPSLVMIGWWLLLRKLVRIGHQQRITSIADLISARFGKSNLLGGVVTVLAVIAATPYIALQLQSVALSFTAVSGAAETEPDPAIAIWVAGGLAVFTILFGTRRVNVNERHEGIVTAIAVEAVVKLMALLAVGIFAVFVVAGGPVETFRLIEASEIAVWEFQPGRWQALVFLSAAAFLCLPRMFHVMVVENADERHLATASWAFPLYLLAMSLFVVPIAVIGLDRLPEGSNPDLFVLTLPLAENAQAIAMLSFLGGFSSATSMVIVAAIALATMISNHLVAPIWLRSGAAEEGDLRRAVLTARRAAIVGVLALGYLYYNLSGGGAALASIGLVSFAGSAQVLPALLAGIFWRGATRAGAATGLCLGFAVWAWCLFLPSLPVGEVIPAHVMRNGPFGLGWLRPQALFGVEGSDPLLHGLFWSLFANTLGVVGVSLGTIATPMERLQGAAMVNVDTVGAGPVSWRPGQADSEDLLVMTQRILGHYKAQALFRSAALRQGKTGYLPDADQIFLDRLERELSGAVGAATAHAMLTQITGGGAVSVEELMRVADETQQIMEYSAQLETKSQELSRTAARLSEANEKLTRLSVQKDAFLSQISHELRTPMTSIRAFSELLRDGGEGMAQEDRERFAGIIYDEAIRLTRLLDDLLDLGVLESGQISLRLDHVRLGTLLERALAMSDQAARLKIYRPGREDLMLETDGDRLVQVFINLITNAAKYCDADVPRLTISAKIAEGMAEIDFVDNGSGVAAEAREMIFEKFARATDTRAAGGAGLGLAICREIMLRLGGTIRYLPGQGGAAFRLTVPLSPGWLEDVTAAGRA